MSRILVVDDEANACETTKGTLESMGYDVFTSNSGEDALVMVKDLKPDIMLLDIKMPGIDGMEVLRLVRQFDDKLGIIMVSAVKDDGIIAEALKKGADKYITKPIDFPELKKHINGVLGAT